MVSRRVLPAADSVVAGDFPSDCIQAGFVVSRDLAAMRSAEQEA